ncbi:MAG TPA: glycosyltransferase family 39 protein [Streptosporangiaceae bacterium]|nr:glycosyltransferase family 39 protein [Streptosporangiaceae bacterium]
MKAVPAQLRPAQRHARPAGTGSRGARLLRGRPGDPAWARPALLALLLATAVLYLAGLSRNGYANEFYAAAVQAGTKSWKAFLFGSVDSANFITVDKTPASLWVMELSARIFGFSYWSLLVPQALEGVAAVGVLYATVRRWFGPTAAIIAGAVLALTPVATLMFRFDNPDALLVLVMTLAAYTTTRAIESGRTRWIAATGALLGLGYLTKMLQVLLVLPAFGLAYLWAGQAPLGRRLWQLLAGGAALVAAAGWWVAIDLLTPASSRPYVGGSTDNNILQLTFGYNGLGRLTGSESSIGGGGAAAGRLGEGAARLGGDIAAGGPPGGGGGSLFGGATGITRLLESDMGGQISWLLPAALIALVVMLWVSRRCPRTDRTRAAALLWGGWLVVTGVVFSYMSGIIHPYYTAALAPPIGALVGIGAAGLWRIRHTWAARVILAGTLLVTAGWAWVLLGRSPGWLPWLRVVIALAAAAAAGLILAGPALRSATVRGAHALAVAPLSLALVAGLAGPLAYSIDTAATVHGGSIPTAGPTVAGSSGAPGGTGGFPGAASRSGAGQPGAGALDAGPPGSGQAGDGQAGDGQAGDGQPGAGAFPGGAGSAADGNSAASGAFPGGADRAGGPGGAMPGTGSVSTALSRLLESGATGYRWAAATVSSTAAASLELGSNGAPVMAIGGFTGSDPAPTLAEFVKLVSAHEIHYFVTSGSGAGTGTRGGAGGPGGGSGYAAQITAWVSAHFTARTVGGMTVYDLTTPAAGS